MNQVPRTIVHSYYSEYSTGENSLFNTQSEDTSLFTRGMNSQTITSAREENSSLEPSVSNGVFTGNISDAMKSMSMIDASLFGASSKFGFNASTTSTNDPLGVPVFGQEEDKSTPKHYLTFNGGGQVLEFSTSISSGIDDAGWTWSIEAEGSVTATSTNSVTLGIAEANVDVFNTKGRSASLERAMAWNKYGDMEVTYALGDGDQGDKFVVEIKFDTRFGTPIFRTVGGATKCPGEPNTMWRENGILLSVTRAKGFDNMEHILPGTSALYDVTITNESPYREGLSLGLVMATDDSYSGSVGGNTKDLSMTINGGAKIPAFGGMYSLNDVPSTDDNGDLVHSVMTLRVDKGAESNSYSGLALKLVSECEYYLASAQLYRDPISTDNAVLGGTGVVAWERVCPPVTWSFETWSKYADYTVSSTSSEYLNVTVTNPDPMNLWTADEIDGDKSGTNHLVHPNVEYVRIQFRRPGVGEWINAWEPGTWNEEDSGETDDYDNPIIIKFWTAFNPDSDVLEKPSDIFTYDIEDVDLVSCSTSRGAGCSQKWNLNRQYFLNGLKEGSWEIRAKVFCSGYDSFAGSESRGAVTDENLNLIADTKAPRPIAREVYENMVLVDFSEPIKCPYLSDKNMAYSVTRTNDCDGNAVESNFAINEVSDNYLVSHYDFECLTQDVNGRNAWMMTVPISTSTASSNALAGKYTVTIKSGHVTDDGMNAASEHTFTEEIMCDSSSASAALLGSTTTKKVSDVNASSSKLGSAHFPLKRFGNIPMSAYAAAFLATLLCGAAMVFKKATKGDENDSAKESAGFAELEVLEPLGSAEYPRNDYGTSGEGVL